MTENNAVVGFVRDYLADGPQWSADLNDAGKDAGYSPSSIGRARQTLGCVKRKIGKAWRVAVSVSPDGDVWVWGIDRDMLGYVGDDPVNATDWRCFDAPPPHELLGPLPDDTWSRVWDTTTNPTQQPEGNQ